ncbi:twin arginine translocation system, TatB protein [Campylobacter sp. RM5004]|uniref:Sec-independent protein translocase protein TatB n=1 Tax=Campylobacter sp. RM5004 TaxID=1660078 RepID=UPI001EFB0A2B|nr:Sec-independent protein translocase protein TatB [Campylobacter sp. RM5004]ULO01509.1 twin arginine translocation system, TatB protein [Campylobacter sp. RM5004]
MSLMEIVIILIVAVLVLGPEKLPGTIVEIAKILKAVKKQINEAKSSIENEINISELKDEARKYKEEITKANDSIRKKLSFEEFDEIKNTLSDFEKDAQKAVNSTIDSVNATNEIPNSNSSDEKEEKLSKREQFLKEKSENV